MILNLKDALEWLSKVETSVEGAEHGLRIRDLIEIDSPAMFDMDREMRTGIPEIFFGIREIT
jgi:NCAIR mutase (PurE)-related protein